MTESPGLVSVIVPVYDSQDTLEPLVNRLIKVFRERTDECEILLVNDGSKDQSWNVIQALTSSHPGVRGLNLMRNFG